MRARGTPWRLLAIAGALVASLCASGCTTNNFNCNVKDACRVPDGLKAGVA